MRPHDPVVINKEMYDVPIANTLCSYSHSSPLKGCPSKYNHCNEKKVLREENTIGHLTQNPS